MLCTLNERRFQFHKGAIRTRFHAGNTSRDSHFNSIKVRLERGTVAAGAGYVLFQFHKGAIRTDVQLTETLINIISIP